jgi:hypothetical protein
MKDVDAELQELVGKTIAQVTHQTNIGNAATTSSVGIRFNR